MMVLRLDHKAATALD